jgi:hypothetical protein
MFTELTVLHSHPNSHIQMDKLSPRELEDICSGLVVDELGSEFQVLVFWVSTCPQSPSTLASSPQRSSLENPLTCHSFPLSSSLLPI